MKKYGKKKKLQAKYRKNRANRKFVDHKKSLAAIRWILKVLVFYEKLAGRSLKYSLAQALLDRMTPEVPTAMAFALWAVNRIAIDLYKKVPVPELPQFSPDSY